VNQDHHFLLQWVVLTPFFSIPESKLQREGLTRRIRTTITASTDRCERFTFLQATCLGLPAQTGFDHTKL
ncbi:MAG: hypothetical protein R3D34_12215, partial [Nitratireductor sp.]